MIKNLLIALAFLAGILVPVECLIQLKMEMDERFLIRLERLREDYSNCRIGADSELARLVAEYNIKLAVKKYHKQMNQIDFIDISNATQIERMRANYENHD